MTDQHLTPNVTRLRTSDPMQHLAAFRAAGLSWSDIARLCDLSSATRGHLSQVFRGERKMGSTLAMKIAAGYVRYQDGDRSYVRKPVPLTIGRSRPRSEPPPDPTPIAPTEPVTALGHVRGLRARLKDARRAGRRL